VVLGIRPEAIAPAAVARDANASQLMMKVWLVQPLGAQMDVYLSTARHGHVVAHTESAASPVVDETIPVAIDMSRAHFFEPGDAGTAIV
jgi:ABC-type sugar transport system ATPase subunit